MSAVTPGSSAPKGSSSSSIFGWQITDCAIDSRCCMPPESCAGYLPREAPRPTASSSSLRAVDGGPAPCAEQTRQGRRALQLEPEQEILSTVRCGNSE